MSKTVDQRRFRRTRLKRATKPLLELFGCTQMELAGHVQNMLTKYRKMEEDNDNLKTTQRILEGELHHLKGELIKAKAQ